MENTNNKPRYIAEIVNGQYAHWHDEFIIFDAPTHSGKTHFVLNVFCEYAQREDRHVLYLCNRKQLRKNIERTVRQLQYSHVRVLTYQHLQKLILNDEDFSEYHYIIFDEIHYLTSDAFNEYTDVAYKFLMNQNGNVCILMSATAKSLFRYLLESKKVKPKNYFVIEKDYSFVEHVYLYKADVLTTIIDKILERRPKEKILVFCNSAKRVLEMSSIYKDVAEYHCSQSTKNQKLKEICNADVIKHYSDDCVTFEKQILFTTKVLDNGIDFKDAAIKHIFTEIFDLDSMVQSLGRKRSLHPSDTCDYYIKNYSMQAISCFEQIIKKQLEPVKLLKKNHEEFYKAYGGGKERKRLRNLKCLYMNFEEKNGSTKNRTLTNGDVRINNMMYLKFNFDFREIAKMKAIKYSAVVSDWLGKELALKMELVDVDPIKKDLFLDYLESKKSEFLFADERKELKSEFEKIGLRDRYMGIHTLNGKLKDKKYPFVIKSGRDKRRTLNDGSDNPNRDKAYWIIEEIST